MGYLPPDYPSYSLTVSVSGLPLSDYLSIPLPLVSDSLPHSLFVHPSTPRQYTQWEAKNHPITCWHVTHFGANVGGVGQSYTCIGFSRSHGIFDGVGAAAVMRALMAEMSGRDWEVPPLPPRGLNENPVLSALDLEVQSSAPGQEADGFSNLGVSGTLKLVAWHLRERWWRGADRRIVLLPKEALTFLVNGVRVELHQEHDDPGKVTTGDILVAWCLKVGLGFVTRTLLSRSHHPRYQTIYTSDTPLDNVIQCSNVASVRSHLSTPARSLNLYPHNAFVPLPYPNFSVRQMNSASLPELSQCLAAARMSLSPSHVISAYKALHHFAVPIHPDADETLVVSNVSASRILETDWSAVGGLSTVCGYRYQLTPTRVLLTNAVYISGRLSDGSVVLDITLNSTRLKLLTAEVKALLAAVAASSSSQ